MDVSKGMCEKEFQAFKQCVQVSLSCVDRFGVGEAEFGVVFVATDGQEVVAFMTSVNPHHRAQRLTEIGAHGFCFALVNQSVNLAKRPRRALQQE
jgi:hypothetical protein